MLRVIVANEAEIQAITNSSHPFTANNISTCNALTQINHSTAFNRTVLGFTSSSLTSPTSPNTCASLYRTCRDIRCPISFRNEYAAMEHLLHVTSKALSSYPTTYEQDLTDLANETLFPRFSNKRHAKIQVRGEKQVLIHFQTWARTAIRVMDVIQHEVHSMAATLNSSNLNASDNTPTTCSEYEALLRNMEEQPTHHFQPRDNTTNHFHMHHTIIRYCADVLGALRREERKRKKKILDSTNLITSTNTINTINPSNTTFPNTNHSNDSSFPSHSPNPKNASTDL